MKIGVLSDTHMESLAQGSLLANKLLVGPFSDIDHILHAGDHVNADIELCFTPCPWHAVRGNMDKHHVFLPTKRTIRLNNWTIGMIHGWGGGRELIDNVIGSFADIKPDVIVFGHSHIPECRLVGSTLLFNPGSPTNPRSDRGATVGVLTLGDNIRGEIISLS